MCGGGGNGPIYPPGDSCPKEITIQLKDILHSGNQEIWDDEIVEGDQFELQPDPKDRTIITLFKGNIIGRLNNYQIHKCISNMSYEYIAILISKKTQTLRLIRK